MTQANPNAARQAAAKPGAVDLPCTFSPGYDFPHGITPPPIAGHRYAADGRMIELPKAPPRCPRDLLVVCRDAHWRRIVMRKAPEMPFADAVASYAQHRLAAGDVKRATAALRLLAHSDELLRRIAMCDAMGL